MSWTGSGRKTAVLCTAVVLLGTLALPAQAAPLTSPQASGRRPRAAARRPGVAGDPVTGRDRRRQVQ